MLFPFSLSSITISILTLFFLPFSPANPVSNALTPKDPVPSIASVEQAMPQALPDVTALEAFPETVIESSIRPRLPKPFSSSAIWFPPKPAPGDPSVPFTATAHISITLIPRILSTTLVSRLMIDATLVINDLLEWQGVSSALPGGVFSWAEYGLSLHVWQEGGHAKGAVTLGVLKAAVVALVAGMQNQGFWEEASFLIYDELEEVGRGSLG